MPLDILTAHRLAHEIEWITAKRCAQIRNERCGRGRKYSAEQEFDPHAAAELGDCLLRVCNSKRKGAVR